MARVKSHTIVEDTALEPYFITKDDYNYIVNIKVQTNAEHFRSKGKSKEYEKSLKFFPNLKLALQFVAEEKLHTKEHYTSLKDFIAEYSKIESNLINFLSQ
jgi:hypothetical protein|tara:strand:- start:286 stop:588 length:303 start_codon:yes stop_codon:yes gene_type:complete